MTYCKSFICKSQLDHWVPVYDKIKWFYIIGLEKAEVASGSPWVEFGLQIGFVLPVDRTGKHLMLKIFFLS